jgi:propanediol dehydratase small subunit
MVMLKDDTKDQIPLFELPEAIIEKPQATTRKLAARVKEKEAPVKKKVVKKDGTSVDTEREIGGKRKTGRGMDKVVLKSPLSGQVPEGDVRLTANIREDLHLKLKIAAARRRTTIGELLEEMVEKYL